MAKQKQIDITAGRMGAMLRRARHVCRMSTDDAATMLRIMPDELAAYEHGTGEIPLNVMEHIFVMGYRMIQVRIIEHRYHNQRRLFRKLNQICTDATQ
ncbi:MAG: helix-turn-helix domain-containing protein [Alphaproteobacteria bacterium]|nr:helix-turn-helix domain-containing protein [Alphaproteobacteria bacterium]